MPARTARDQAARGNRPRSGRPGRKSISTAGVAAATGDLGFHGPRRPAHQGAGPSAGHQVPLGDQLVVGLDHDLAGELQVGGQHPGRRQRRAGRQPARADGRAQPVLDLRPQVSGPGAVKGQEQLWRTGTHNCTPSWPRIGSTRFVAWSTMTISTSLRSALWLPLFDELADPIVVARLAAEAEEAGWHGVFVWDHLRWREPVRAVADPWITLAAVATATERLRFGPMVTPLARRRPAKVARETATLDRLSGGRLTLGVGPRQRPVRPGAVADRRGARRPGARPDARRGTGRAGRGVVRRAGPASRRALHRRRDALPAAAGAAARDPGVGRRLPREPCAPAPRRPAGRLLPGQPRASGPARGGRQRDHRAALARPAAASRRSRTTSRSSCRPGPIPRRGGRPGRPGGWPRSRRMRCRSTRCRGVTPGRAGVTGQERIVEANGVPLCLTTHGDPADPAILLIHGACASLLWWDSELLRPAGRRGTVRDPLRPARHRPLGQLPARPARLLARRPGRRRDRRPGRARRSSVPTWSAVRWAAGSR